MKEKGGSHDESRNKMVIGLYFTSCWLRESMRSSVTGGLLLKLHVLFLSIVCTNLFLSVAPTVGGRHASSIFRIILRIVTRNSGRSLATYVGECRTIQLLA